jgi:DDE superfamily endonuclease
MLPGLTLPASLAGLLWSLRPVFTGPSFRTFCGLVAGLCGQVRRRTVCGMLLGAGLSRCWPHDRAHYFFARAAWDLDQLGVAVARLVVALLVPAGAAVIVAVDDSVFRRAGRKVYGAAWQHDGSSPARDKLSFGTCFVTAGIIVALPFSSRPWCLPVLARLHVPGRGKAGKARKRDPAPASTVCVAVALVTLLARAFPDRAVHVVADAHYHGPALREVPGNVTWTTRLPRNAVLYALAPPRVRKPGRPPRKGRRLGTPADLAAAAAWAPATVRIYRRDQAQALAEVTCLWYGCLDTATVRVILARDAGRMLALVTTDLDTPAAALIERYAARWEIEQAFADARIVLGAGEARNRVRRAVQRTVPFALLIHTLVVIWYTRHGHDPAGIHDRRAAEPWYTSKAEPAFEDMLTKLRRVLICARISGGSAAHPEPRQITAVLAAWHAAAA